jgi:hypothetical protein
MYYDNITESEIRQVYSVLRVLRKLKIIGYLEIRATRGSGADPELWPYDPYNSNQLYAIKKISYSNDKSTQHIEEILESIVGIRPIHYFY